MPQALTDMAAQYDSRNVQTRDFDPIAYFVPVPDKLGCISTSIMDSVRELCEAAMGSARASQKVAGDFMVSTGDVVVEETAVHIFKEQQEKHAFEGTLVLSLIERVSKLPNKSRMRGLKEKLRKNRRVDPMTWELARHFGRPSVPREVLPVFAAYEAEKRLGRSIKRLTEAQMRVIGL